ncbi:hypothetical protein [Puniceibacterium sp. IMCC21224]|uniref:hypothetical protein n=1 Tax=Puniceibacterium sp. IMCC21224 TaxID=1618204 RepID=UPI00064E14A1|nr:hypothetical protein [Puniceibacterium sp. IMCC21224]KMK67947.1 hypothetical protein IMCC21224_112824 [Puniceibacterium sp. IMCC21224]
MGRWILAAAVLLLTAARAQAADTYVCQIAGYDARGWIPEVLFLGDDREVGRVIVSDPLILYFNDSQPLTARIAIENVHRITFVWTLDLRAVPNLGMTRLRYRATYLKATQALHMSATAVGDDAVFTGSGTCKTAPR